MAKLEVIIANQAHTLHIKFKFRFPRMRVLVRWRALEPWTGLTITINNLKVYCPQTLVVNFPFNHPVCLQQFLWQTFLEKSLAGPSSVKVGSFNFIVLSSRHSSFNLHSNEIGRALGGWPTTGTDKDSRGGMRRDRKRRWRRITTIIYWDIRRGHSRWPKVLDPASNSCPVRWRWCLLLGRST